MMSSEHRETTYKIQRLKRKLAFTDYKTLKFAEGELSAEEYEPVRLARRALREQINELQSKLPPFHSGGESK